MSNSPVRNGSIGITLFIFFFLFGTLSYTGDAAPLRLVRTIPMPGVTGRIDHMAVDVESARLFVVALGNNSLEILDTQSSKPIYRITGLNEPQGVLFLPELKQLLVSNGGDGDCKIFDSRSFQLTHTLKLSADADNVRYDNRAKYIYVGYGGGGLAILEANNWKQIGNIPLSGHPESFQLEASGSRIFVNVPEAKHIAVVDRIKLAVIATWHLADGRANFPMALDEKNHRLFIGCRKPSKIIIYDTGSGKEVTRLDISGDVDDIFYDAVQKRIYASCGEGFINVLQQDDADHYKPLSKIPTAAGARTSLLVPEQKHLYLAIPYRGDRQAEIRVYATEP